MKRNKNMAADLLLLTGGILILGAAVLFMKNRRQDQAAGEYAELVVPMLEAEIEAKREMVPAEIPASETETEEVEEPEEPEMTITRVEGQDYIGYLTIPSLELVLPVISDWSYPKLRIAPCRQFGTVSENNLVIAGHNYQNHFGRFRELDPGDELQFTDMEGNDYSYRVGETGVIAPDDVDVVQNSPWDLVLYTCTPGGKSRVMIGADKIE